MTDTIDELPDYARALTDEEIAARQIEAYQQISPYSVGYFEPPINLTRWQRFVRWIKDLFS